MIITAFLLAITLSQQVIYIRGLAKDIHGQTAS